MASPWNLHLRLLPLCFLNPKWGSRSRVSAEYVHLKTEFGVNFVNLSPNRSRMERRFRLRAVDGLGNTDEEKRSEQDGEVVVNCEQDAVVAVKSEDDTVVVQSVEDSVMVDSKDPVAKLQEMIISSPPVVFMMKRYTASNLTIMCCIATAFLVMAVRAYVIRKARYNRPHGSVADLVRRGQLRSDRRGISSPLKYEDPFNNPLVKFGKSNSTVEMCGKVYRLAPVTLTNEEQSSHQKRRSRAYQWKRPTIFLKEGDSIPPDVDPDTIRWIPANHPFATTASEIDEDLAQTNVYQKHGVPFRIKAEHEALQRKLEALQSEQKLDKLVIDPSYAKDFERPFKSRSKSHEQAEQGGTNNKAGNSMPSKSDHTPSSFGSKSSDEMQKP